jgi:hypothetical protein
MKWSQKLCCVTVFLCDGSRNYFTLSHLGNFVKTTMGMFLELLAFRTYIPTRIHLVKKKHEGII